MNINEILAGFEIYDGEYKREHIEAALSHKEEITPHLIAILEKVREDPQKYAEDVDYFAYTYALMLLGHFQEPKAHQVIVDLFSLPDPLPDDLFGDTTTEDLPVILLRTCGGSLEGIKSLIQNKNAYEFSRGSALTAMVYAVVEGLITREEAFSFFGGLLTGDEAPEDSCFHSQLVCDICDLYPEELMDKIKEAFDKGLIEEMWTDLETIQKILEEDNVEKCLTRLRENLSRKSLDNIHESMSWWACFNPEENEEPVFSKPYTPQFWEQPKTKSKKKKAFWEL
ncbi:MAG: DUF1186 family protein [Pseudanabaena sp. Salubria-1]|jgi:hypothetical protein|nr:DUF1186 family protein [Pseudanabaena sp. Salubria-1]MCX5933332.1 DUF1186 domain-containing protein [Pseudanabaena sp. LacPavin_0818_WC45_MAG_42_6]